MRIVDCDDLEFENTGAFPAYGYGWQWKITDRSKEYAQVLLFHNTQGNCGYVFLRQDGLGLTDRDGNDVYFECFEHCFATRFNKEGTDTHPEFYPEFKAKQDAWYASYRLAEGLGRELDR